MLDAGKYFSPQTAPRYLVAEAEGGTVLLPFLDYTHDGSFRQLGKTAPTRQAGFFIYPETGYFFSLLLHFSIYPKFQTSFLQYTFANVIMQYV